VSEQDVIDVLNILDPNKAVGPDIISNKMLIAVKNEVAKPLSLLFSKSFQCKIFPNNWKIAFIIPLFKRGDIKSFAHVSKSNTSHFFVI
jgi:hypothetical protein